MWILFNYNLSIGLMWIYVASISGTVEDTPERPYAMIILVGVTLVMLENFYRNWQTYWVHITMLDVLCCFLYTFSYITWCMKLMFYKGYDPSGCWTYPLCVETSKPDMKESYSIVIFSYGIAFHYCVLFIRAGKHRLTILPRNYDTGKQIIV